MKRKIGYIVLFVWAVILAILIYLIFSFNYNSSLAMFVYILSFLVVLLLPVSAFLLRNKVFKVLSLVPLSFALIYLFVIKPFRIDGNSMSPTLKNGEFVLLNQTAYLFSNPKVGDIVIYNKGNKNISRIIKLLDNNKFMLKSDSISISKSEEVSKDDIDGKVFFKYWPETLAINTSNFVITEPKEVVSSIKCDSYVTSIKKDTNLGVIECGIITSERIDTKKSYCESNLTKTKAYFQGFLQENSFGYSATINDIDSEEVGVLVLYDLKGNFFKCKNKLVY
jgi:signal peptidase I